ncbi:MAG: hypothetical protein AAFO94_07155 [Bacteroidota bacterium]
MDIGTEDLFISTTDDIQLNAVSEINLAGAISLSDKKSVTLTANQTNWNPGTDGISTLNVTVSGVTNPTVAGLVSTITREGAILIIKNVDTSDSFTLNHSDGTATSSNRWLLPNNSPMTIPPRGCIIAQRENSRWYVISKNF